jgi:hypothetical protein
MWHTQAPLELLKFKGGCKNYANKQLTKDLPLSGSFATIWWKMTMLGVNAVKKQLTAKIIVMPAYNLSF